MFISSRIVLHFYIFYFNNLCQTAMYTKTIYYIPCVILTSYSKLSYHFIKNFYTTHTIWKSLILGRRYSVNRILNGIAAKRLTDWTVCRVANQSTWMTGRKNWHTIRDIQITWYCSPALIGQHRPQYYCSQVHYWLKYENCIIHWLHNITGNAKITQLYHISNPELASSLLEIEHNI